MFLHFMCMINFVTIQNWNRVSSNLGIIYVILFVAIKAMVGMLGRKVFENIAMWVTIISNHLGYVWVRRLCLRLHFFVLFFLFLFSRVLGQNLLLWLLFMPCAWTVAAKFDLSNNFQPISAHLTLFTDPQISLFSNFFIKNGSHDTIHTFKNYFAIVFFSFSFQLSPNKPLIVKCYSQLDCWLLNCKSGSLTIILHGNVEK